MVQMKIKRMLFAAAAAFAFGSGFSAVSAQASGQCNSCYEECDENLSLCLSMGYDEATAMRWAGHAWAIAAVASMCPDFWYSISAHSALN
jgi:hypothetical protein